MWLDPWFASGATRANHFPRLDKYDRCRRGVVGGHGEPQHGSVFGRKGRTSHSHPCRGICSSRATAAPGSRNSRAGIAHRRWLSGAWNAIGRVSIKQAKGCLMFGGPLRRNEHRCRGQQPGCKREDKNASCFRSSHADPPKRRHQPFPAKRKSSAWPAKIDGGNAGPSGFPQARKLRKGSQTFRPNSRANRPLLLAGMA